MADVKDVVNAVLYLVQAADVSGEVPPWMVVLTLGDGSNNNKNKQAKQKNMRSHGNAAVREITYRDAPSQ